MVRVERAITPEPSGKYRLARSSLAIDPDAFLERPVTC
jgi:hypothetical protein